MTGSPNPLDHPISDLTLPHFLKHALSEAGYKSLRDLEPISAEDLSVELGIGIAQAEDVLRNVRALKAGPSKSPNSLSRPAASQKQAITPAVTVAELLAAPVGLDTRCLSAGCRALDGLLGRFTRVPLGATANGNGRPASSDPIFRSLSEASSGIVRGLVHGTTPPGTSIEIAGPPGIGKTSIVIAMILNACLDATLRGEADSILLLDTEGGLLGERLWRAAEDVARSVEGTTAIDLLSRVRYLRVDNTTQLLAIFETIDLYLDPVPLLVVIDTLSFHLRHSTMSLSGKTRALDLVRDKLRQLTEIHKCSVLITNQLSTKLFTADNKPANFDSGEKAILVPQLGDAWCLARTIRMVVFRGSERDGLRYIHAFDGDGRKDGLPWACFDIGPNGLPCDIEEAL